MQLKTSVATALAAASAAKALLVPPELSDLDVTIAEIIEVDILPAAADKVAIDVDCPGCPLRLAANQQEDFELLDHGRPNHLELSFAVEGAPDGGDRLTVNGFELYPSVDRFQSLGAAQVLDDGKEIMDHDGNVVNVLPQRLGYSLAAAPVATDVDGSGMQLVQVDLQVIEVGDVFVGDIPNVRVKLVKSPDAKLIIGSVETTTSQTPVDAPNGDGKECITMMCKWIAFVQDKVRQMKNHVKPGCHGKNGGMMGHHGKGWAKAHGAADDGEMHQGGHHGHHGGHHGHHGEHPPHHSTPSPNTHNWGSLFRNIASHILLPVLIGIVAGVSMSLIGMVIGTLAVKMWRAFFRRPSQQAGVLKEDASSEEKSGLIEHQDSPPAYEDAGSEVDDVKKMDV